MQLLKRRWTTCTLDSILETLTLHGLEALKMHILKTTMEMLTVYACTQNINELHTVENDISLTADIDNSPTGSCTGDLDRQLDLHTIATVPVNHTDT